MSSLIRRIQRMPKRTSVGAKKRAASLHIGDMLGIPTRPVKKNALPKALRRSKKTIKWLGRKIANDGV